ncbi:tRNA pseudouridine(55) synthase TruB [Pigmentiphaga sp. NML080357]|uniref:tRNA pseudouridine(55) synthase TruB n=1 Tax=Pigmentiphaga sp. NML080357 TaxID=2008675 RepID=UPI000B40B96E|nr:tRNA pseudouridine(55) synthase TruB [Pigmentiphaga sp. NML080357]OVZ57807.1 tRNA pseudouridine(55) synthase TruB [Pigmentiphaga sp. NML080357]
MASRRGRALDGVLLLDKPEGLSSNHALQRARRILDARKAGHTGTLDPFATGLMVLCFGEATKFSGGMFHADKRYTATMALGEETDSGDRTGLPVAFPGQDPARPVDEAGMRDALSRFVGMIAQVPPMYSALKREGRPLYEYAREGVTLEREPREVTIHELRLVSMRGREATIDVGCSKGTYIRTLAQDIGRVLGCGAHLTALRRTRTAGFDLAQAWTLERLEALADPASALLPADVLLEGMDAVRLDAAAASRFMQGRKERLEAVAAMAASIDKVRVYGPEGKFLGTARRDDGWLQPDRLISFKETT